MKFLIKKLFFVLIIILLSFFISILFGVLHNQVTYSISNEFFTDFLFGNFGINEWGIENDRIKVSIVGIIGTYWFGLLLGLTYSLIYLFLESKSNFKYILKALLINTLTAISGAVIAYFVSKFFTPLNSGVWMDFGTEYPQNYLEASYIHRGSYIGGIAGLIFGIIYLIIKKSKYKKNIA